jgi:ATP-dependent protease ClpP protease subunit
MMTAARSAFFALLGRVSVLFARGQTTEAQRPLASTEDIGAPEYVEDNGEGFAEVRLYGECVPHSIAGWYLPGEAYSDVGFARVMDKLRGRKVLLRINSIGGDVFSGIAIASRVREDKPDVLVEGVAASIASVIAAASSKVTLALGSSFMVHSPWSYAVGNAKALRSEANILDQLQEAMLDIYEAKTRNIPAMGRDAWRALLAGPDGQDGTWLVGAAAVAVGLADSYQQDEEIPAPRRAAMAALRRDAAVYNGVPLPQNLEDPGVITPASESPGLAIEDKGVAGLTPSVRVSHRPGAFYLPRAK